MVCYDGESSKKQLMTFFRLAAENLVWGGGERVGHRHPRGDRMNKDEIIKSTLTEMGRENGLLRNCGDELDVEAQDYVDLVIATLADRLPQGELKTCKDFNSFGVACCECCHRGYAHYDMSLEELNDCSRAWLCCSVRNALCKVGAISQSADTSTDATQATEVDPNRQEDTHE
jgi:hypothetical protein